MPVESFSLEARASREVPPAPMTQQNMMIKLLPCGALVLVLFGVVFAVSQGGFNCTTVQLTDKCVACSNQNTCTECAVDHQRQDFGQGQTCTFPCSGNQIGSCTRCSNTTTCSVCEKGYLLGKPRFEDATEQELEHDTVCLYQCNEEQKGRSCTQCDSPGKCEKCAAGFELTAFTEGPRKGETTCSFICTDYQKAGDCTACESATKCTACRSAYTTYKFPDTAPEDIRGNEVCDYACTVPGTSNIIQGTAYAPGACERCQAPASTTCAKCRDGYTEDPSGSCALTKGPEKLEFYMYRAVNEEAYPPNGANLASSAGVMSYINVEVVSSNDVGTASPPTCERKYNIHRILRYKVTMKTTPMIYKVRQGQFGQFVAFDYAQCTFGAPSFQACNDLWDKYGYTVGCQTRDPGFFKYPDAHWYSLPGTCPQQNFSRKTVDNCDKLAPGGECKAPDGTPFCTYNLEPAGEVSLDELVGICTGKDCCLDKNNLNGKYCFKQFCLDGKREFRCPDNVPGKDICKESEHPDDDLSIPFWKGYSDLEANRARTQKLEDLFETNYPTMPRLVTPVCDGF